MCTLTTTIGVNVQRTIVASDPLPYAAGVDVRPSPTQSVHPRSWETLGAQVAAFVFVVGSYVVAQEVKVKRPRRRSSPAKASAQERERVTV